MRQKTSFVQIQVVLIIASLLMIPVASWWVSQDIANFSVLVGSVIVLWLALQVIDKPYLGLIIITASLPVTDIIAGLPFASLVFPVFGAVTLGGYLWQNRSLRPMRAFSKQPLFLRLGAGFILWFTLTNMFAAVRPAQNDRIWFISFAQLWVLAWLAGRLLDTRRKHYLLMAAFSISSIVSAVFVIFQGQIGETALSSLRGEGLSGGANTAARYFIVAIAFMYYLFSLAKSSWTRLLILLGIGMLLVGVLFTVSRTGMLLVVSLAGLLLLQRGSIRHKAGFLLIFLVVISLTVLFSDSLINIFSLIIPSILRGTDTVGLRYAYWQAGWRMWLAHPITGIGIGQFQYNVLAYSQNILIPGIRIHAGAGAHNMYVQVLAETGLVGFIFFIGILANSLYLLLRAGNSKGDEWFRIVQIWVVTLILLLLGGITKHDHYDKLLWLVIGISGYFTVFRRSGDTS